MPRKTIKACPGGGFGGAHSLTYRETVQSLFLHRISIVREYLSIATTIQDPARQDPHQLTTVLQSRLFISIFCFFIVFKLIYHDSSITVVPIFYHCSILSCPPNVSHIQSFPHLSLSMGPLYMFLDCTLPLLSTVIPLPASLPLLSVHYLFPCLQFYFVH